MSVVKKIKEFERKLKSLPEVKTCGRAAFLRHLFFLATSQFKGTEFYASRGSLAQEANVSESCISRGNSKFNGLCFFVRCGPRPGAKGMEHVCLYNVNLAWFMQKADCAFVQERLETLAKPDCGKRDNQLLHLPQLIVANATMESSVCDNGKWQMPLSYIDETKEKTIELRLEREEARASNSSAALSPSPSFLDRFYGEWEQITGTSVERQLRIAKWFNVASDDDKELAIANVSRYAKAAKDLGKTLKHPYFFLEDREFSKAYVVDTPLALTENRKAQSTTLTNNHSPEIQKQLIEELGEPVYKSWFEQCHIAQSSCDIEVTAPNNFVKETVEELLGNSMFRRSYNSIKVMVAEFVCVLVEYFEPIEQCCCLLLN